MLALILCSLLSFLFAILGVLWVDECDIRECLGFLSAILSVLGWIVFVIMLVFAIAANVGTNGKIAAKHQIYDSLVYQLENDLYDNDNDIGKRELYEKVTDWNADLAQGRAMQHDPWVGVFYPNIYDNLEFIKLP